MKEDEIKKIAAKIDRGLKYWTDENKDKFERFRNFMRIRHYDNYEGTEQGDKITVPFVHALIRSSLPYLYYRNPEPIVKPKKSFRDPANIPITLENLERVDTLMKYLPEEIGMEKQIKRAVFDYRVFGKGVVEIGFEYETLAEPKKGLIKNALGKVAAYIGGQNQEIPEEEMKILVDRFYVRRVAYPIGYFIIDPDAEDDGLSSAKWCAEKIIEPLEDVKANKKFADTKDLTANVRLKKDSNAPTPQKDEEPKLEYWRYWEKNKYGVVTKCYYIVPDQKVILSEKANPYDHKDWPYEELDNYAVSDYLYPLGDIEPIETMQTELDKTETLTYRHGKTFIQKYRATKGKLDQKAKDALAAPENTLVEVEEDSGLAAIENPAVNSTLPMNRESIEHNMTKISGISDYDTSVMPDEDRTLGEARLVQSGANNRKEDARKSVEEFVKRVFRKLLQVVQQYATSDFWLQVGAGDMVQDWRQFSPEQIQGEYDVDIEPMSAMPIDKEAIRQDSLLLYKTFIADQTSPLLLINDCRKWVIEAFDKEFKEEYTTMPAPPVDTATEDEDIANQIADEMVASMGGQQ